MPQQKKGSFRRFLGFALLAMLAARLLRRFAGLDQSLDTLRQAVGLIVYGAAASTIVSAAVGVLSLTLSGVQPWSAFGALWRTWWLGDATAILLIVPLLLTWHAWRDASPRRIGEGALIVGGLALTSAGVFVGPFSDVAATHFPLAFVIFPFLIWAATRFGTAGAAAGSRGGT